MENIIMNVFNLCIKIFSGTTFGDMLKAMKIKSAAYSSNIAVHDIKKFGSNSFLARIEHKTNQHPSLLRKFNSNKQTYIMDAPPLDMLDVFRENSGSALTVIDNGIVPETTHQVDWLVHKALDRHGANILGLETVADAGNQQRWVAFSFA